MTETFILALQSIILIIVFINRRDSRSHDKRCEVEYNDMNKRIRHLERDLREFQRSLDNE